MFTAKDKGQQIETLVAKFLQKHGMRLIARNYSCRAGEIDLIMQHQQMLVFVEVRYRQNSRFGSAIETVNYAKQRKIIHTAEHYLQQLNTPYAAYRFDVVGVSPSSKDYEFEWIQNAFQLN